MEYRFTTGGRNRRGESSRRGRGIGRGLAGGRNFERGESSCRGTGTGRGSGDAEDETPFTLLDASCAYHDRFGKRHFVMPKSYRDPCGFVEDPSDNQTGYGLADARLLKWPALFIERVQMERLCRENRLKVPKAHVQFRSKRKIQIMLIDYVKDFIMRFLKCAVGQPTIWNYLYLSQMPRRTEQHQMLRLSRTIMHFSLTLSSLIVQTLRLPI
ncbi:unnamed protein product [Camellia sinensis]